VDVESYRRQQERMAILEGIARGEMAVADGRVVSEEEAERRLDRWLK
jgi:predicted transcriptional regulator